MRFALKCAAWLGILFAANIVHAQLNTNDWAAIETTTPLNADVIPFFGTFFSAANPDNAPAPANFLGLSAWNLGGGYYLLDDLGGGFHPMLETSPPGGYGTNEMGDVTNYFSYIPPTNGLYLQITNTTDGIIYANLNGATDCVYEIFSTTNLPSAAVVLTNWDIETEVFPGINTNSMPFCVPVNDRNPLFLWARDWTGITSNENQTPDWWFWRWFGTTDLSDSDLDSQGQTLLTDYQNQQDPDVINFSVVFTNNYVNTSSASGIISIQGGEPFYEAVLVNDLDETDAVWQPFTSTNLLIDLGTTNGPYTVLVGLRGLPACSQQSWAQAQLNLNDVGPALVITNPANSTVSQPIIQLQGLVSETLSKLTFDISNASGVLAGQQGYWQPVFYDTNVDDFTTNTFQCYDVKLTNGLNTITLYATDLAGNTTAASVNYTLDYSTAAPPVLDIIWPQSGTAIGGSNFTLQAQVDDDTATVTAQIMDANGDTNTVQGLVERSGLVWAQNLPLAAGTNILTVTATNAAGLSTTTNLTLVQSTVTVTVDPLTQFNQTSVTVTGTISDPTCSLTVNGASAYYVDDEGDWEADNVPVNSNGTATFDVEVYTSNSVNIASQVSATPQPPVVWMKSYDMGFIGSDYPVTVSWTYQAGGEALEYGPADTVIWTITPLTDGVEDISTIGIDASFNPAWEYAAINDSGEYYHVNTRVMIAPQGQAPMGAEQLYLVYAAALEFVDQPNYVVGFGNIVGSDPISPTWPMPPQWLQINGQTLADSGQGAYGGGDWGETIISAPAGTPMDVTPVATQYTNYQDYTFMVQVTNVTLISQCLATTPADQARTNLGVNEQVNLFFNPPLPANITNITWSTTAGTLNLMSGPTNLFTAPDNATNVAITATLGNVPISVNFQIYAPTGALLQNVTGTIAYTNPIGLGYYASWYIKPDNVSFYNVKIAEGVTNAVTTGYFLYEQGQQHTPGPPLQGGVVVPGMGTLCQGIDQIQGGTEGPPYTNGTYVWHIPWSYITPDEMTNYFTMVDHIETLATTSSNVILTIQKQGSSGSVTISN